AALWTGIELTLPVLVAFGVLTRPAALVLFAFNLLAVFSYPYLFTPAGAAGLLQHVIWGGMLLVLFVFGPGNLSCDRLCVSVISPRETPKPQRLYQRHTRPAD
ncbi:DoxX family protein, partial [Thiothrix subterranea]